MPPNDELSGDGVDAAVADAKDFNAEVGDDPAVCDATSHSKRLAPARTATLIEVLIVVLAGSLVGYLSFRTYQSERAADQTNLYVEAGTPTDLASAVRVALDKANGHWLISQFEPV